jgi:hypothetical protein
MGNAPHTVPCFCARLGKTLGVSSFAQTAMERSSIVEPVFVARACGTPRQYRWLCYPACLA